MGWWKADDLPGLFTCDHTDRQAKKTSQDMWHDFPRPSHQRLKGLTCPLLVSMTFSSAVSLTLASTLAGSLAVIKFTIASRPITTSF